MDLSITVARQPVITKTIEAIDETAWVDIDYTDGGTAHVAEAIWDHYLLIVRRTSVDNDPQAARLFPTWRHHAFVTNRDGGPVDLDVDHRAHAVPELAIRDLKHGAGLTHCPSGIFNANPAWLVAITVAHNLIPVGPAARRDPTELAVAKTLRRRLLSLPGRLTRTARRLTLRLPTGSPWQSAFEDTLTRLRADLHDRLTGPGAIHAQTRPRPPGAPVSSPLPGSAAAATRASRCRGSASP